MAWYAAFRKRRRIAGHLFRKAVNHHHKLDMKYEEAKSLRDYGLFFEDRHQPGLARDCFNRAYALFDNCGASVESGRLRDTVDAEVVKRAVPAQESSGAAMAIATGEVAQIRMDTLYDASLSLTQTDDMDALLHRVVVALIKVTGAHYGYLRLDGDDRRERQELVLTFDNRTVPKESITWSETMMRRAVLEKRIIMLADASEPAEGKEGSALCVPIARAGKALGCVYLANQLVAGLFSENAVKAAQIIAAQAGFLIENARLMEEYRRLNAQLERKVSEQTDDIHKKNDELHIANIRLIESERMKSLLSGSIVHDIKNSAAAISGHIRLLTYRLGNDTKNMRSIDLAVESCVDIVSLASNLLDISKMEEGRLTLQPRRVYFEEMAAIAQKCGGNVMFDEKKITVAIIPPDRDFAVLADPYLVERVIQNLFSNAAKYTETGGSVKMTFEEKVGENIVTFFSSGAPIPPDQRDIIFEKYSRLGGKASPFSKGLGLFFCRMVMTAQKGRIWLDTDEHGNYFRLGFRKI